MPKNVMPRYFYIPKGAIKVADRHSDAVAYIYTLTANGKPAARVFFGKQSKPVSQTYYGTEAHRERHVTELFKGRQEKLAMEARIRTERLAGNALAVNDILEYTISYSMTSVTFYQVVAVKGQSVEIRKIASKTVSTHRDGGTVIADPNNFTGPVIKKRVQHGTKVTIEHGRHACKWDGKPAHYTDQD